MKKLLTLVLAGGMASFIACGPSAEEIEKEKKRMADSIARADSIKQAEEAAIQDSIAKAQAAEKDRLDSIRVADSIAAAANKPKPKSKEQKQKEEVKKVVKGRG